MHDSIYYELFKISMNTDIAKAKNFARLSLIHGKEYQNWSSLVKSYRALGYISEKEAKLDSAIYNYKLGILIGEKYPPSRALMSVLIDLGVVYDKEDIYDSALHFYNHALKVSEKIDAKDGQSIIYNNMGLIFLYLDYYSEAERYLRNSIRLKRELGFLEALPVGLTNIAIIENEMGKYDSAIRILHEVQEIFDGKPTGPISADINYGLGLAFFRKKEYQRAVPFIQAAISEAKEFNNSRTLAYSLFLLAEYQIHLKNNPTALQLLKESERLAADIKLGRLRRDLYYSLSRVYSNLFDLSKADAYQRKFLLLKDSLFNNRVAINVTRFQLGAQKDEMESVIQTKEGEIRVLQTSSILVSVIAFLLVIIVILLGFGLRSRGRINKILDAKVKERTRELVVQNQELNLKTTVQQNINARLEGKVKALTATLNGLKQVIKKDGGIEARQSDSDKREEGIESRS